MPDVSTEVAIATTTLGSSAGSITFSSIPATYTDLRLVFVVTGVGTIRIRFNADTGSSYSNTILRGITGAGVLSSRNSSVSNGINLADVIGPSTTIPSIYTADIFSYAGSTNKTLLSSVSADRNGGTGGVGNIVGLWRNTSAITSIVIDSSGNDYYAGSTATLYGIL